MRNLTTELKVGLLILGSLGLIVYSSVLVTGWQPGLSDAYEISVTFDDAAGLLTGTPVQVAGIKVGQVSRVELVAGRARVVMEIFGQYRIHADARATIKSLGILGDKYISLELGTPTQEVLKDGDTIVLVGVGSDLDSLVEGVAVILNDVQQVTAALRDALGSDQGKERLESIFEEIAVTTRNLSRITEVTNARIETIIGGLSSFSASLERIGANNEQNINETLANLAAFSRDMKEIFGQNREALNSIITNLERFSSALGEDGPRITSDLRGILDENRERLGNSIANLERSFEKLDTTMTSLDSISAKLDAGEGSLGKLINDETTVDELNEALTGLNRFLTEADRIKLDLGFRTEYLQTAGDYKSTISLKLQPLKDRYYLIELVDNPRGKITETSNVRTVNGTTSTIQDIETTDELQLSLLIAQRYYDTELRGGLIENSGGVGIAQYFGSRDQYRIGLDVWDFGDDLGPHVRLMGYWRFFSNAFLVVGGDDIASKNEELRDAFFGIGIEFNEDSLKPLLTSVPISGVTN